MTSKETDYIDQSPLYGLVLAGGKSVRMGHDKGRMQWHGKEQRYFMADMLQPLCTDVFISCRAEQQHEIAPEYKTLIDSYEGAGPLIAILSAMKEYPDSAWLVVACDLPLLNTETLTFLIRNRDSNCIATTFESPFDQLPEPLITIWEPASFTVLLEHISEGYKCPRKALIRNTDRVKILVAPDATTLKNANTPEDVAEVRSIIK